MQEVSATMDESLAWLHKRRSDSKYLMTCHLSLMPATNYTACLLIVCVVLWRHKSRPHLHRRYTTRKTSTQFPSFRRKLSCSFLLFLNLCLFIFSLLLRFVLVIS